MEYVCYVTLSYKAESSNSIIIDIKTRDFVVSFIAAYFNIVFLKNIELAMIGVIFALSIRSMIGELLIGSIFKINVMKNVISEFLLSIIFIICNYYIGTLLSAMIFAVCVFIYIMFERDELISLLKKIWKKKY